MRKARQIMNSGVGDRLIALRNKISDVQARLEQREGARRKILKDLWETFKLKSEDIPGALKELDANIEQLEKQIAKILKELEDKHGIAPED